ncbi:MAG: D-alanine--D-alanine ligase [Deltaproteobacteria bacterium]|nr:D-alanine--D-alanine ligase [Deltaproteobacteria bacterium]
MGGISPEREISLETGKALLSALEHRGYQGVPIDFLGIADLSRLMEKSPGGRKVDVLFNALHGPYGEDGTIQGFLEILRIPYTGSGVLSSAICMDKVMSKRIFQLNDIPTPSCVLYHPDMDLSHIPLPAVVKPSRQGSTIGISIVREKKEMEGAVKLAKRYDRIVLIEEYIRGREAAVGVLDGKPLTPIGITPAGEFYDFDAKYLAGTTEYHLPALFPKETLTLLQRYAARCFDLLGCRSAVRIDFIVDETDRPFVLEVNTLPGMTAHSLLPKAAAYDGIEFDELVERILDLATLDYC